MICTPSLETVGLEWELPQTVVSNEATTVVQYIEPLRHTLTIRANINHNGNYTCSVVGDEQGAVPSITASVRVLESKIISIFGLLQIVGGCYFRMSGRYCWWCVLGGCL